MRILIGIIVLFILLLSFLNSFWKTSSVEGNRMIADFESIDAIWMSCLANTNYMKIENEVVNKMENNINVMITMVDNQEVKECKEFFDISSYNNDLLSYSVFKGNDFWIRDHGPVFVYNKFGDLAVVNFEWSQYGVRSFYRDYFQENSQLVDLKMSMLNIENKRNVDSLIAVNLKLPIVKSWICIEGGAMETNGNGSIILNKSLLYQRNPGVTIKAIEDEFKRVLGTVNFIWLNAGLVEDVHIVGTIVDNYVGIGTGGHTDEFVRFADPKTILLAWVPEEDKDLNPINKLNYERLSESYKILKQAKDIDGSPFKIIKIPQPKLITQRIRVNAGDSIDNTLNLPEFVFRPSEGFQAGDSLIRVACASYLNYFLTNSKVFLQSYVNHGTNIEYENQVIRTFKIAFPSREIVPVDARSLNWYGGGLHCATMSQFHRKVKSPQP
ncbi:MAG: agmatine deiminase family protein [Saprospiraceae bacterium]